jgi:Rrf2 family protein
MRLTRASSYAVHALAYMARQPPDAAVASHVTAEAAGVPERQLLKLLRRLAGSGLLRSSTGPYGGFWLARPAKDITLLEVIEAVDGPIRGDVPDVGQDGAAAMGKRLRQACDEAAALVRERLSKVTLAELARAK